jgi:hypothetical protein
MPTKKGNNNAQRKRIVSMPKKSKRNTPRPRGNGLSIPNRATLIGANQSVQRVNHPTGGRAEAGTDLVTKLTVPSRTTAGSLILDTAITPSLGPRLSTLASAWQRIRYLRMRFQVNATGSSLVGGSYVAAFIPDPTDKPPLTNADSWVMAHEGATQSSWWVSVDVVGPCPPQTLYTSFEQSEPRLSSPGRFVIACINPPSADTTLSLNWDWRVAFSQPSLERLADEGIYTLNKDCRLPLTDYSAGLPFVKTLQTQTNDFGSNLVTEDQGFTSDGALRPTDFSPQLPLGTILALPDPITLNSDTGASGAPENAIVTGLGVVEKNVNGRFYSAIAFFYTLDGVTWTELKPDKPFSIRPSACPVLQEGSIFEEGVLSGPLNVQAAATSTRSRRSLTLAPALRQLSSGKVISMLNSLRF